MRRSTIQHRTLFQRQASEPEILDRDMRPTVIADTLRRLRFDRHGRAQIVEIADREVRDYLVAAVTRQAERAR